MSSSKQSDYSYSQKFGAEMPFVPLPSETANTATAATTTANGAISSHIAQLPLPTNNDSPLDDSPKIWACRRTGKTVRNALFFSYEDCKLWIETGNDGTSDFDQIEYSTFQNIADAVGYLQVDVNLHANGNGNESFSSAVVGRSSSSSPAIKKEIVLPFKTRNRIKATNNPKRRPTKAWDKMFEKLKEYAEANGTTDVPDTPQTAPLWKWRKQQDVEYKNLLDGRGSSMFQAKIDLLESIGHKFTYISVEDKYTELLKYKEGKGNYDVPFNHPVLGKWMEKHRACAKKLVKNDATSYFDLKFKEFTALGVNIGVPVPLGVPLTSEESQAKDHDENWDHYYEKLVVFKKEHGNLDVTPENDNSKNGENENLSLHAWIRRQHQEYQRVQDRKASKLTTVRMQRLTDIGFVFQQRKQSIKWEDRLKQLRRYKLKNGHVRVPKSDPELGVFVNRQRYEFSKLSQGKPSSLTQARLNDLQELGFVFVAGKSPKSTEKKTWDTRYQELVDYKKRYGHCMVAQKAGLGEWVHSQRLYYRKLKEGKKSPITPDRLLMLANIGFVFDATKRRGNSQSPPIKNNNNESSSMAISQQDQVMAPVPQAPAAPIMHSAVDRLAVLHTPNNPPGPGESHFPPTNFKPVQVQDHDLQPYVDSSNRGGSEDPNVSVGV